MKPDVELLSSIVCIAPLDPELCSPTFAKGSDALDIVEGEEVKKFATFSVGGWIAAPDTVFDVFDELPSFTGGCSTGLLAAGTRSAGESRLNVPDAPSKGLLLILERDFDILNIY